MSFDKDTRNALAKMVTTCRRLLTADVTDQLQGRFGMHPDGTCLAIGRLDHLAEDETAAAEALRELQDHFVAGEAGRADQRRRVAYDRLVLEISFTTLNRLAALRLCEERGLVVECVRKGTASDGFRLFERVSGGALGTRHQTYRVFLECLFDELAMDLGVLFDRSTPQSAVFPSERCLTDVLAELNKPELSHLWAADETIGWIYQYFNPPEERKAMRDASPAPRNSRELAVRNQFFTPRYVVEFLTDNTLGRIWYEMRKGNTALKRACRYLVRRPNEVFLVQGEKAPASAEQDAGLSQEELLRQPVHIEHRSKKDPRDLRVLDPACGSGHFLLYAFDLLERIYEEAWADPESPEYEETGHSLREDYANVDDLRRSTPKLIIEHNLHGIDIDRRAVQIAALALWLRAQKAWKNLGLKPADRPQIERSNIVTAEPMPGEEDMRQEFIAGLKPRVLGQLVDVVFEKMTLAGEAGSLLKIDEEIKHAVSEARMQWLKGPRPEQQFLFPDSRAKQHQLRFDVSDISDERFWVQAEDHILAALRQYAERAETAHAVRRRLFAKDAARGFAFIDLCRRRYDVVLMNPPFGVATAPVFALLKREMPSTYTELYAGFVKVGLDLVRQGGRVGAITSRAFLYINRLATFRKESLASRMDVLLDLGGNVMDDAFVEACAYTISPYETFHSLVAADARQYESSESFSEVVSTISPKHDLHVYVVPWPRLSMLPSGKFLYYMPREISDLLKAKTVFEPDIGTIRQGMGTFDDFRFVHLLWEVPSRVLGQGKVWEPLSKGGPFAKYYSAIHLAVNWWKDGAELCEVNILRNGQTAQVRQASDYWRRGGCTYSKRSAKGFSARALPRGCIMAGKGPAIISQSSFSEQYFLGWLNSRLITGLIELQANASEFNTGILKELPWLPPSENEHALIADLAHATALKGRSLHRWDETDQYFAFLPVTYGSLREQIEEASRDRRDLLEKIGAVDSSITRMIDKLYGVDSSSLEDLVSEDRDSDDDDDDCAEAIGDVPREYCEFVVSGCVGVAMGRWDVRYAADGEQSPMIPDPFDLLPVCQPGALIGSDGLPAESDLIVSDEWLRARPDANTLLPARSVKRPTIPDAEYPLRISWDGVLVDDPGTNDSQPHRADIVRRGREVLDRLWKDKAYEIEQEACDILGVSALRDYFRRPSGFFQDHLKRYSKSRRKAPIYWPLSTASGSYTLWLYYHRLTDQTLYAAVNKYVEPKITEVEGGLTRIEDELKAASGRDATRLRDQLNETQTFVGELRDLREELLCIAALPYKPDLNDGVIINAAPFHKLFRLRSWAKDTEQVWKKLEKGDYDWSHLAYTLWPERVREVCRKDRSIAIAHGLEDLCEVALPTAKGSRKKKGRKKEEVVR